MYVTSACNYTLLGYIEHICMLFATIGSNVSVYFTFRPCKGLNSSFSLRFFTNLCKWLLETCKIFLTAL